MFLTIPILTEQLKKYDLLVTYIPKHKNPDGLAGITHALHFVITPFEAIDKFYKNLGERNETTTQLENLFGSIAWEGEIKVGVNLQPKF